MIGVFACLVAKDERPIQERHPRAVAKLEAAIARRTLGATVQATGGFLAVHGCSVDPDGEMGHLQQRQSVGRSALDVVVAVSACLTNRARLADELGLNSDSRKEGDVIAAGYLRWGPEDLGTRLAGEYAMAIWDPAARRIICYRDKLGVRRLYYGSSSEPGVWVCSSSLSVLLQCGLVSGKYDGEYFRRYLIAGPPAFASAETPLAEMRCVRPGHFLMYADGVVREHRYWRPEMRPRARLRRREDYYELVRHLMTDAVRSRLPERGPIWMDLSGGMDSTSLVFLAHHLLRESEGSANRLVCRSIVHPSMPEYTELEFIRVAQETLNLDVRYETFEDIPLVAAPLDVPEVQPDEPTYRYLGLSENLTLRRRIAESGGQIHISGYGADNVFHPGTLLYMANLMKNLEFGRLYGDLRYWLDASDFTLYQLVVDKIIRPLFVRQRRIEATAVGPWLKSHANSEAAVYVEDTPLAEYRDAADTQAFHHICDGPKTVSFDHLFAVEGRFPFMDVDLVEGIMSFPPEERLQPPLPKGLLRGAMDQILPEVVLRKFHQPGGTMSLLLKLKRSRSDIRGFIGSSRLADMGLVAPGVLTEHFERIVQGDKGHLDSFAKWLTAEFWLRHSLE